MCCSKPFWKRTRMMLLSLFGAAGWTGWFLPLPQHRKLRKLGITIVYVLDRVKDSSLLIRSWRNWSSSWGPEHCRLNEGHQCFKWYLRSSGIERSSQEWWLLMVPCMLIRTYLSHPSKILLVPMHNSDQTPRWHNCLFFEFLQVALFFVGSVKQTIDLFACHKISSQNAESLSVTVFLAQFCETFCGLTSCCSSGNV